MTRQADSIDRIVAQWRAERPDLDTRSIHIGGRIARAAALIERHTEDALARHGLDLPRYVVLATLRRSGPPYRMSPTQLFRILVTSSGGMTHRIDVLEEAGLIRRVERDGGDRRTRLVELTPKGRRLTDRAVETFLAAEREALAGLSPRARAGLSTYLRELHGKLEEDSPRHW